MKKILFILIAGTGLLVGCNSVEKATYDTVSETVVENGQTNVIETLVPKPEVEILSGTASAFGPWGSLAGMILSAVAGGYASYRNAKAKGDRVAEALVQSTQVVLDTLEEQPEVKPEVVSKAKGTMKALQHAAGVLGQVQTILNGAKGAR